MAVTQKRIINFYFSFKYIHNLLVSKIEISDNEKKILVLRTFDFSWFVKYANSFFQFHNGNLIIKNRVVEKLRPDTMIYQLHKSMINKQKYLNITIGIFNS